MGIPEEQTNGEEVLDMCKAMEEIAGKLHVTLGEVKQIIAEIGV